MRHLLILICLILVPALAGCDGERSMSITSSRDAARDDAPLKVIATLQCPQTSGDLTRKGSAQAGGTICTYSGPRGAEVTLHLVTLDDATVDEAMAQFENQLAADMPQTRDSLRDSTPPSAPKPPAPPASSDTSSGKEQVDVRMPGMAVQTEGEKASVRMPGVSIDADGDKARVRIGGFSIDADDGSQEVNISSADDSVSVQANDDTAQIRTRAPGSATRATWLLTDNTPSSAGWRLVGYEARGPSGGPIVVATVRAKERDDDRVFDDAKDLVTLNVGE